MTATPLRLRLHSMSTLHVRKRNESSTGLFTLFLLNWLLPGDLLFDASAA